MDEKKSNRFMSKVQKAESVIRHCNVNLEDVSEGGYTPGRNRYTSKARQLAGRPSNQEIPTHVWRAANMWDSDGFNSTTPTNSAGDTIFINHNPTNFFNLQKISL
jgi:hypothetical protein